MIISWQILSFRSFSQCLVGKKNAAQEFDQWQLKGRADGMAAGHRHGTEGILQQWQFGPNSRVLDVGCGQGWLVRHICEQGVSLGVGVDVSEEMIKARTAVLKFKQSVLCFLCLNPTF